MAIKDPRQASKGTKYTLKDAVWGAFSVFCMQSESCLEHQRHMDSRQGKSNATTIFGMIKIPTVPQIRNILDGISATFTCLETSHAALSDWLKYLDGIGEVKKLQVRQWNKNSREIYSYR